jgi:glycosyltransferase involved in cell wall biosynthesis
MVTVSDEIQRMVSTGYIPSRSVLFIPPGVDSDFFGIPPTPVSGKGSRLTVFTSRRLEYYKGIDIMILALASLVNERKLDLEACIVGTGIELGSLRRLARESGIADRVRFAGLVKEEDLLKMIRDADICVIPSRWEGTPIALFEYMAAGKPVIASAVGGIPAVLSQDNCLVRPGDPVMLAEKIWWLANDERTRLGLGARNRQLALSKYTWAHICVSIEAALMSCCDAFHHGVRES